jgi:SPP1 family predicted phage head-tail adaptor
MLGVNVGKLKDKIEIFEYQEPDTITSEWVSIHQTWCSEEKSFYKRLKLKELMKHNNSEYMFRNKVIYIRYTDKINEDCRILYKGQNYVIEFIEPYYNDIFLQIGISSVNNTVSGVV